MLPRLRIRASRHSAFYSPLLSAIHFLRSQGHEVEYSVLAPGQRSYELLRDGVVDIMQSAVSSNWLPRERGMQPLPVHFAQINRRDGFFLVGRAPDPEFHWKKLEGSTLLADHGVQPLLMLKYAVRHNAVDWNRITVIDAGAPEAMESAFRSGQGDYVHLQAPVRGGAVVASVGASMPPVAFSSLCCARDFQNKEEYRIFRNTYERARAWVRETPANEVVLAQAEFFDRNGTSALTDAISRYQGLGCWEGSSAIPRDLYEQALNVFEAAGAISCRHPYEDIVG
jgi:NitT/TauT family transport system substrate-binding protein